MKDLRKLLEVECDEYFSHRYPGDLGELVGDMEITTAPSGRRQPWQLAAAIVVAASLLVAIYFWPEKHTDHIASPSKSKARVANINKSGLRLAPLAIMPQRRFGRRSAKTTEMTPSLRFELGNSKIDRSRGQLLYAFSVMRRIDRSKFSENGRTAQRKPRNSRLSFETAANRPTKKSALTSTRASVLQLRFTPFRSLQFKRKTT